MSVPTATKAHACAELVSCSLCDRQQQCGQDPDDHSRWLIRQRLAAIQRKILVMSNKGGVGKSTVAANLAAALAARGLAVGLADADISGPSVPHLFGLAGTRIRLQADGFVPPCPQDGLKVMSLGFLLSSDDAPVMWRDSFKQEFLQDLLGGVAWGALDVLVVDMPPGTGGELIGVVDLIGQVDGAVVVTTPQELALNDVRRGIGALRDSGVPVLGVVENMAGLACPHCGGEIHPFKTGGGAGMAAAMDVPLLGAVPLDPTAMAAADAGTPIVTADPESAAAQALAAVADRLWTALGLSSVTP